MAVNPLSDHYSKNHPMLRKIMSLLNLTSVLKPIGVRAQGKSTFSRSENGGASWSAVCKAVLYLMDSKKRFGIIRAALSLLKSVYDFPHNPKVAGSNPAPATN
jgi:hypothetical protein